jgi:putative ABC transport system permease protein
MGRESLSMLGLRVGDTVRATGATTTKQLTIVGIPVFPDFGFGPGLGRGAAMTMDGLRAFYPDATLNLAIGTFTEGEAPEAAIGRLEAAFPKDLREQGVEIGTSEDIASRGTTIKATLRAGSLPLKLSVLLAFAAFATLVHLLLTSVRRRRRDLAILQTLGFRRGQIMATVAWQALILAGIALVIGIPIGIMAGRLAWSVFAYRLGVVPEPAISPLSLIVIPAVLVVSLIVAVGPGLVARRTRPAAILKAE